MLVLQEESLQNGVGKNVGEKILQKLQELRKTSVAKISWNHLVETKKLDTCAT